MDFFGIFTSVETNKILILKILAGFITCSCQYNLGSSQPNILKVQQIVKSRANSN